MHLPKGITFQTHFNKSQSKIISALNQSNLEGTFNLIFQKLFYFKTIVTIMVNLTIYSPVFINITVINIKSS
jgi:hypothetical protein